MLLRGTGAIESSPLQYCELPDPQPGPDQVRLKISCCAICRTDLHVIEGDLPEQTRPIIPGHQIVGVVDQVGENCSRLHVGDRVGVAWLRHTCGRCRYCWAGNENLCEHSRFTGYHEHGGYAEMTVVAEDFAYHIPEVFTDQQAAPLLCAGIIGYRALERSNLRPGDKLGIYGFGSSAHVVIQIALHRACEVYVVTRGQKHIQLAREMGATWAGETADEMPINVDSAIIFAPAGELVPQALKHLDKGGTLALAGIYMSDIPSLNYEEALFYERNLRSVTANTRRDGHSLLKEASEILLRPRITTYPLADANRALQDLKSDQIGGTGLLVI